MAIAKILHADVIYRVVHSNLVKLYACNKFLSDTITRQLCSNAEE